MKKLRLDMEELRVDSFDPGHREPRAAGVRAHSIASWEPNTCYDTCQSNSQGAACTGGGCSWNGNTCDYSCQSAPCVCNFPPE